MLRARLLPFVGRSARNHSMKSVEEGLVLSSLSMPLYDLMRSSPIPRSLSVITHTLEDRVHDRRFRMKHPLADWHTWRNAKLAARFLARAPGDLRL